MAQWLGLRAANARGMGLIPGWGTKIPPATCGVTKRQKNKIKTVTIQQIFTTHLLHARCGTRQWQHTRARQFPHHWNLRSTHSVQFSCSAVSSSLQPHGLQHTRPPCPSPPPGDCSNPCPSSRWCHPTISACRPLPLLPSIFPSIRVFSSDSVLHIRWPKYWSFSFSISPSNEHSELISFRMDWLDLLAVQGTLKSLLQHHSSKASILWCSVFFIVQLSHPYMTTGKTTALTRQTFVDKVMSLLFNMLSTLVIAFLPRSKHLLISWLQSPSAVILEPKKIFCHCFHCFHWKQAQSPLYDTNHLTQNLFPTQLSRYHPYLPPCSHKNCVHLLTLQPPIQCESMVRQYIFHPYYVFKKLSPRSPFIHPLQQILIKQGLCARSCSRYCKYGKKGDE